MTSCPRLTRSPRYADQDQADQGVRARRTRGTKQAGQPGQPDHVDRAGRQTPRTATATAAGGDVDTAAVAAYRASVREGRPLSERKLAAAFGKTSRRWARDRMSEARQVPAAV